MHNDIDIPKFWWTRAIEPLWLSDYMNDEVLVDNIWEPLRNISTIQIRAIDAELKKIL